jgi:nephrocystin-4
VRLPSSTRALAAASTALLAAEPGLSQLHVRSSDPSCVCESRAVPIGQPHDVFIKAPTGPSPTVKKFFVAVYADQHLAVPLQIWQIYVHSLHRIDVTCTQGQTSRFSLILK